MNREEVGKFLILRELQYKEQIGKLNALGRNTLISLQFDEDLNKRDMKEVLEFIDELEHNQNQKAIECLKEVRDKYKWYLSNYKSEDKIVVGVVFNKINYIIDNKIKELEEK